MAIQDLTEEELQQLSNAQDKRDFSQVEPILQKLDEHEIKAIHDKAFTSGLAGVGKSAAALGMGAADTYTMGYAPNIAAGAATLVGEDYTETRDKIKGYQEELKADRPGAYLSGQGIGIGAQLLTPISLPIKAAGVAGNLASKIPKIEAATETIGNVASKIPYAEKLKPIVNSEFSKSLGKSAGIGAAYGAIENTPEVSGEVTPFWDEKDLENRGEKALYGSAFGAGINVLGAGADALIGGVDRGWQALGPKAKFGNMSAEAESANRRATARANYYKKNPNPIPEEARPSMVDGEYMDINQEQIPSFAEEIRAITRNRDITPVTNERQMVRQFKQDLDDVLSTEGISLPRNVSVEKEALPHIDFTPIEKRVKGYDGRLLTQKNIVDHAQKTGVLKPGTTQMLAARADSVVEEAGLRLSESYAAAQNEAYTILRKQGVSEDKINLILNTKDAKQLFEDISRALDSKFSISVNKQGAINTIKKAVHENAPGGADSIIKLNKLKQVFAEEAEFVKKSSEMTNQQEVYKYATQLIDREIKQRLYVLDQITGKNYGKRIDLLNKDYSLSKTVADMTLSQDAARMSKKEDAMGFINKIVTGTPVNSTLYSTLSPAGRSSFAPPGSAGISAIASSNVTSSYQKFEGYPMNMLADVETDNQRKAYEQSIQNSSLPNSEKARRMNLLQKGKVFLGK